MSREGVITCIIGITALENLCCIPAVDGRRVDDGWKGLGRGLIHAEVR